MKHGTKLRRLGRSYTHKKSMLRNMVSSLIEHQRIETTVNRAKELRRIADRMVTHAKEGGPKGYVKAGAVVRGEENMHKLMTEMADRYRERAGGYTRILRTRTRESDSAPMCYIEYIDREGELREARTPKVFAVASSRTAAQMAFEEAVAARHAARQQATPMEE
mmetsp:Transcript_10468/g.21784  ORF Transcript_10468/g.21784 Transcript_10468/m.21784 type:complete len:164 (-) Transcript_10468:32-523(-)|eukprot:CAMPEP_0118922414 /NCGR_PEP_ID=MMETSP1169-20130426/1349_1 /TAXON_ID=36882 /ORGANISM="Pyramimonas obovata, Strain CCMP722" /LENGTH=163 /DNA_ID=CAMNT_0006863277 /DNA_START=114 /DNA_END=605 /DNA_ORIENTATION=+